MGEGAVFSGIDTTGQRVHLMCMLQMLFLYRKLLLNTSLHACGRMFGVESGNELAGKSCRLSQPANLVELEFGST